MRHTRSLPIPAVLLTLVFHACGAADNPGTGGAAAAADAYTVDPAEAAVITGVVHFEGAAPAGEPIDMRDEPTCAAKHGDAAPTRQPVIANANGTLRNVFVYVKEGLGDRRFATPAEPVVLDQDGCVYIPHVMGVQAGQPIAIRNSDGLLHNVNARAQTNPPFNLSQPRSMEMQRTFNRPEIMIPVRCDVHGWMEAYIGVVDHPYYTVTGEDGAVRLDNLPPGTYTIEAWHERYGTQTTQITVGPQESAEITFTFNEGMAANAVVPLGAPFDPHDHQRVAAAAPAARHH